MPRIAGKSIKILMNEKITSLLRYGQSKHEAKAVARAEAKCKNSKNYKVKGIYSIKTTEAYRQTACEFADWLNDRGQKLYGKLDIVTKEAISEYLKEREDNGLSAWTLSKDLAALNKIFEYGLTKKEIGLKQRKLADITRSRLVTESDKKYNEGNYIGQIEIAKAFGLRRESIFGGKFQIKEISLFKNKGRIFCSVIEKGGRYREAPCLNKYKSSIEMKYRVKERERLTKNQFTDMYNLNGNNLFFEYTSKIDNHAFRAEYSNALYEELADKKETLVTDYKGYDKSILKEVSIALGHFRVKVVVDHYLCRK